MTLQEAHDWINTHPQIQVHHVMPGAHSRKTLKKRLKPDGTYYEVNAKWFMSLYLDCAVGKILLRSEAGSFLEAVQLLREKLLRHYEDVRQYI